MLAQYLAKCVVHNVGSRMVASNCLTAANIYRSHQGAFNIRWQLCAEVNREVVLTFGINNTSSAQGTRITYLTTHLSIEWRLAEYHLVECFTLLLHTTIAQYLCLASEFIVADKLGVSLADDIPIT